jgi:hypothetical protein
MASNGGAGGYSEQQEEEGRCSHGNGKGSALLAGLDCLQRHTARPSAKPGFERKRERECNSSSKSSSMPFPASSAGGCLPRLALLGFRRAGGDGGGDRRARRIRPPRALPHLAGEGGGEGEVAEVGRKMPQGRVSPPTGAETAGGGRGVERRRPALHLHLHVVVAVFKNRLGLLSRADL